MNPKEKAMRNEAKADIIKALRDGYTGYYCDLHDKVLIPTIISSVLAKPKKHWLNTTYLKQSRKCKPTKKRTLAKFIPI